GLPRQARSRCAEDRERKRCRGRHRAAAPELRAADRTGARARRRGRMSAAAVGIVTGASRGLGLALVRALVDRGWRPVVDARGAAALARAVSGLDGVVAIAGDVTDPEHRRALVEAAGGHIDLVVNNAGVLGPSPQPLLAAYPLAELARVYDVNVFAPLALIQ